MVAGCCVMMGPLTGTVMEGLIPVTPANVPLIVALPLPTAVMSPLLFTVNTPGLLLVQLVTRLVTCTPEAWLKDAAAPACWVCPAAMLAFTEMLTDVGTKFVTKTFGPATALTAR